MTFSEQLAELKVLPVLTVTDEVMAEDLCHALMAGGIKAVEITLRSEKAVQAISLLKQKLPDLQVSAGTVITADQVLLVSDAGADFIVSPGMTESLVKKANALSLPFLPGVATASEVMRGRELGLSCFKLFPAVTVGGTELLKSLAAPLSEVTFCPTGGLNINNFTSFLDLPNVVCVGGTWMADSQLVANNDWQGIEQMARETMSRLS